MARKQTLEIAGDATMERITVAAVSRIGVLIPPYVVLILLMVVGAVSHAKWGDPPAVVWATMFGTFASVALAAFTWLIAHSRGPVGRMHATVTAGGASLWFTVATITGPTSGFTLAAWFFGGGYLAVFWNARVLIRQQPGAEGITDPLAWLFNRSKGKFGLNDGTVRTTEVTEHAIKGKMQLPPGEKTQGDALKSVDRMESGLQFPPGSVVLAEDEDDASRMHVTVTDPRTMKKPLPWIGPYRPGGSIAEPLRPGLYQDMSDVLHTFIGHYMQTMGAIGSGKSIGGCWNYCAEIMTRYDAAIFAIDMSKDTQTFGPMRNGLHRFETTKAGAVDLVRKMHAEIPKRTKRLAEHGYQKWAKGCGLTYWYLWIEEFPKFHAALGSRDADKFEEVVKEIRSAGGSVILSYQRSDYTQGPTIVRGQLGKMCFGVMESDDAGFGLSERQKEAGASPELWGNHQPGMAFLDVPGIAETRYAMPLRTFSWGKTDREANAAMKAHAAQWPAAAKTVDEFTARLVGTTAVAIPMPAGTDEDDDELLDDQDNPVEEYQTDDDPDPTVTASPDDEVREPTGDEADRFVIPAPSGQKMPPAAARGLVHDWIRHRSAVGKPTFTAGDPELRKLREAAGMTSRGWTYKVIEELQAMGVIVADDSASTTVYSIDDLEALDRTPVGV
ncbi:hypothetical protein [Actinomadura rudentiformis]|uniref:FtsK gamma domain-containing protein n=1 Tax=Actinomadura rudentiformis TaxID=359158 RepID=A0A6H9YAW6_9ACTN|nr:hypothetical protein [Actinomadura rudentiformis]KAB2341872.1 hypothetical protein F8566_40555 [Actinomadura rudentiformis]